MSLRFAWKWTKEQLEQVLAWEEASFQEYARACEGRMYGANKSEMLTMVYEHWKHRQDELERRVHATFEPVLQKRAAKIQEEKQFKAHVLRGVVPGLRFHDNPNGLLLRKRRIWRESPRPRLIRLGRHQ